jgi:hypothetical protein
VTIFVGEAITVVCAAVNPLTGLVIADANGQVEFYGPGKQPKTVPGDRVADQGPVAVTFNATVANKDGTVGAYVAYVDTTGWAAGKWSYRVTLTGSYNTWEYGSFTLAA